jgi:hypothetical protein
MKMEKKIYLQENNYLKGELEKIGHIFNEEK